MARFLARRIVSALLVLVVITYISFLAQGFAWRSRLSQPTPATEVMIQALRNSVRLWGNLPRGDVGTYLSPTGQWGLREAQQVRERMGEWILNSLALLLLAMLLGGIVGGLIGTIAAAVRRSDVSLLLILTSIVGISTPSFFLGMLLQYLEITLYKHTGLQLVPVGGFGWDSHLVLPVMVLAARPIAQIARLTYVRVAAVLDEDYVRTARAKGLPRRSVWTVHIIPNMAASVLTAMGTSLRFSLSSLPVVEFLFGWPGAGKALLEMLSLSLQDGATTVALAMGALFVAVNVLLDVVYHALDPRLREAEAQLRLETSWQQWLGSLLEGLWAALSLRRWRERRQAAAGSQVAPLAALVGQNGSPSAGSREELSLYRQARMRAWLRATARNPALLLGLLISLGLLFVVIAGPALAPHDPYGSSAMVTVAGKQVRPPVSPSSVYPLGTDSQGRDILSLLLAGARRTLTIALFAVVARLMVGGSLGFLAGWFAGSRLDRLIVGAAETLAAFPALLMAMLIVYGVGVRQGLSAFVIGLSIIGWGEVMQTVRSQVMAIKPTAYIEGAVATGLSEGRILSAHVLPNVWPTMVSLAFLEMGSVLMILGELGFLGVFIGGGFAGSGGDESPPLYYYDVPEWSVMLANSWRTFRSFPWAALYPALAFFGAILGFTFLGEGLRQMTERLTLSLRSLFNRYTLALAVVILVGVRWMFQSTSFVARYAPAATAFNDQRAMADIDHLADSGFNGRLSGSADADKVAEWIAGEFESLGLQPGGADRTYFQPFADNYRDLVGTPTLIFRDADGQEIRAEYGRDFVRSTGRYDVGGAGKGEVTFVALKPGFLWNPSDALLLLGISAEEAARTDRVLLRLSEESAEWLSYLGHSGVLTMSAETSFEKQRFELLAQSQRAVGEERPSVLVSRSLVDRLLAASGHTVDELSTKLPLGSEDESIYLPTGWSAELTIPTEERRGVTVRNVIALWPGADVVLDAEMIVIAANYDGLGRDADGTLYPGANDNVSGVAVMLETIRTLKEQGFRPNRSILFVAWVGGERHRAVDYAYFLKAGFGFSEAYQIVAGLELEGVGAGTGSSAVIWHTTRERLTEVVQRAARQVHTPLSTREQGLHADSALWPSPSPSIPSATISWSGSDALAHTPQDTPENLDPAKLGQVGRMVSLALMALANDPAY